MKKINQARSIDDALNIFRQGLPDPVRSSESTIINRFMVSDKEIVLNAQKAKGSSGMCWKIAHKSYECPGRARKYVEADINHR